MTKLDDLRARLGEETVFACLRDCTTCCTEWIGFNAEEWERVSEHRYYPATEGELLWPICPFKGDTGCTIHTERPIICRLYGISRHLLCKKGVRPSRFIPEELERELWEEYTSMGPRWVHFENGEVDSEEIRSNGWRLAEDIIRAQDEGRLL